jgi:hypothetical protein
VGGGVGGEVNSTKTISAKTVEVRPLRTEIKINRIGSKCCYIM